jgi:rod shape determining protein RodA
MVAVATGVFSMAKSQTMKVYLAPNEESSLKKIDYNFAFVILALQLIGLINLYSATHGFRASDLSNLFLQQILWLGAGWGLFFGLTFADYQLANRLAYLFYGVNLSALLLVEVIGTEIAGVSRWINLGFFRYQPSETMKLAVVLALGRYLANKSLTDGMGFKELAIPALLVFIPAGLIAKQPDLGSASILVAIGAGMCLFVGVKTRIIMGALVLAMISAPLAWTFALKDYQRDRIRTFISPNSDPKGAGYHSIQSRIAVGSGKILGKGFRKGTQAQLEFLPERHTDFIFSVLGEEHGFIGSVTTVALFVVLMVLGVLIAGSARDKFGALVAVGVVLFLFFHVFVNVGMVIGLLPVKGSPLPLFSYGGSNMLATMLGLGLISSVSYRKFMF